jgi:tetratricopeptide (TPR) repeat protein
MTSVAVSPDGRWLAVGSFKEAGVRVWDLRRRRFERLLRPTDVVGDASFYVGFSPDGHWLISGTSSDLGHAYHFWRAGTWDLGRRIADAFGPAPAFTEDGRLMALAIAADQVLLAEAATGRELARLTTLQPVNPTPLDFSPDGTKLIARTNQKTALVWDLRRIRDQLAPMELDWDAPPYPVASAASEASGPVPPPRPVRVVGEVLEPQTRRGAELTELTKMNRRLAANPDDAEALIHRGWLLTRQKQWPAAIADLERRLRLRPDDADAMYLLATAQLETNQRTAAGATLEKYLAQVDDDIDALALKGLVALQLGRLQEADDDFSKVLEHDPDRGLVRGNRADIRLRLGRLEDALADVDTLIARYPQDPRVYELRSRVHDRLGRRDQALADLKRVADLPAPAGAYNNAAWRLATGPTGLRDPEQALALARKAVASSPDSATFLNTLGVAQYRVGHLAEAITTLEKSLAAGKGESDAFDLFFLAMARYRLGQIDRARAQFDRAVNWRRDHPNQSAQNSAELDEFQAEAQALLNGPLPDLPNDVFAPESPNRP